MSLYPCMTYMLALCMYVPLCVGRSKGKQGYKCYVSLKGGIQIICTLENDATLYIGTTNPLLIVDLRLWI